MLKNSTNKQRWSPPGCSWPRGRPRGHILMFLASKPQVLENCLVLGSRTAVFFELLKVCGAPEKFFGKRFFLEIVLKFFLKTFFLESTCTCVLGHWPWPRAFLSLASRVSVLGKAVLGLGLFFVSLASSFMSSTPPLLMKSACGGKHRTLESLYFSNGSSRKSFTSFNTYFVLLDQLASSSYKSSTLKKLILLLFTALDFRRRIYLACFNNILYYI